MTAFSLGTVWEETIAFMRRESSLLAPVALAIFGPAQLLLGFAMAGAANVPAGADKPPSLQMLLLFPAMLSALFGYLAISLLVLVPGISVAEALSRALRSFPKAIAAGALVMILWISVALAIVTAATLGAMLFGSDPRSGSVSGGISFLIVIPMVIIVVRMLLFVPVLAMEQPRAVEALRRLWALSRDNILRFVGVWALFLFLAIVVALVDQLVIGSIFQLLKLGTGDGQLLATLHALISAGLQAILSLGMTVYLALTYRAVVAA